MRLTAKERILLYLAEHSPKEDSAEAPPALTRERIARASWINARHLSQYIQPLTVEGLVRERQAHVEGIRQRRKVYDLTEAGWHRAGHLRQELGSETVKVSDASGVRETTVSQVLTAAGGKVPLSILVNQAAEQGTIDLASLQVRTRTPYVEMMTDAPKLETFTGRREELRAILEPDGQHQIFVIQGVAGMGKSSLAAKACELERGKRNIFWHKVRSWDTHQTLFAALGQFFRALDRPVLASVVKRGDARRAAEVVREELPGTRSLLVFDDAHEASRDVVSFLSLCKDAIAEAPDAQVLVLTRRRLSFYDSRDTALTGLVREINLRGLEPEALAAMFANQRAPSGLLEASRRLHGHPLLCQLLLTSASEASPAHLPRGVHAFMEEQVYPGLTREEALILKTISLFRVPVPRSAILAHPEATAEDFRSLVGRFLIRPVGKENFEVHDTVRDFFLEVLTAREREVLSPLALEQLKFLTSTARAEGDFHACVDYLSNALRLPVSPAERATLQEALGDANARIGDLSGAVDAYRMSAKTTEDREALVRLRRKSAEALIDHGEFVSALKEADAALRAIGDSGTPERGWLQLIRCRIATARDELGEARESGRDALRVLADFGLLRGQAEALLELGRVDFLEGRPEVLESPNLESALEIATRLADPELVANAHLAMAELAIYRFADPERALRHLTAIEAIPSAVANPAFACRFFWTRGWLRILLLDDRTGAMDDFEQARELARRLHDVVSMAQARSGLGMALLFSSRIDEARAEFSAATAIFQSQRLAGEESNARWVLAVCCLMQGDWAAFRKTLAAIDAQAPVETSGNAPREGAAVRDLNLAVALHGFEYLLKGDSARSRESFREALRMSEGELAIRTLGADVGLPMVFLWYGIAVRAMGYEKEGNGYFSRGMELLRTHHLAGALALFGSEDTQRFQLLLHRAWQDASLGAARPDASARDPVGSS